MNGSAIPGESIELQIADVLREIDWPANKDEIVDAARDAGASGEVVDMFDGLPEQDYADGGAVLRLIGSNFGPGLSS
ncbi:DUF2795 domain-containing protein [Paraburkholderia sp.]|uniref:DUF2795 domain-containing protein n=1 Tax=Paraburkholderia sp. TaxID=1926495 RepID=UPI0023A0B0E1|nr:DUF2795 domain-containing protein [Paraburkholderia sp.]MDE1184133.1 DUF2795 domain-containing protein [Paraburkholderia sp.]